MAELQKVLTKNGLTLIVIGACIGSGIFVTPAFSLRTLPDQGLVLLIWLIGGIVSLYGAITFSELGSRHPNEGGVYVYLKKAFGPMIGFLYGWIILLIVNTGALAALGLALADYITFFIPMNDLSKILFTIIVIWGLTIVNIFGVNVSQNFASLFTTLKLLAMFLIIGIGVYALFIGDSHLSLSDTSFDKPDIVSNMLLVFTGVFWSFGGWHHATYLSGEAQDPQNTIPSAMTRGILSVTLVYLAIIVSYMVLLPVNQMVASDKVAGDAVATFLTGEDKLVSIAIIISVFGTIGIYTMTAPRIFFAMAKDKIFFSFLTAISTKYGTPYKAMLFQAAWATILVLIWGKFTSIITFVTFMDIVFMALATSSIFVFRRINPSYVGYKMKGYPWIPLIYLFVTVAFIISIALSFGKEVWIGLLILFLGIPVYFYFAKKNAKIN